MAHFLLELYSEEIPHGLQIDTRKNIESLFKKKLEEFHISYKKFFVLSSKMVNS